VHTGGIDRVVSVRISNVGTHSITTDHNPIKTTNLKHAHNGPEWFPHIVDANRVAIADTIDIPPNHYPKSAAHDIIANASTKHGSHIHTYSISINKSNLVNSLIPTIDDTNNVSNYSEANKVANCISHHRKSFDFADLIAIYFSKSNANFLITNTITDGSAITFTNVTANIVHTYNHAEWCSEYVCTKCHTYNKPVCVSHHVNTNHVTKHGPNVSNTNCPAFYVAVYFPTNSFTLNKPNLSISLIPTIDDTNNDSNHSITNRLANCISHHFSTNKYSDRFSIDVSKSNANRVVANTFTDSRTINFTNLIADLIHTYNHTKWCS